MLSDEGREFLGLAFYDLALGTIRWVETPDWDVERVAASASSRYLARVVNEDGYARLRVRDLTTGRLIDVLELPDGSISLLSASAAGGKLGFPLSRSQRPTEVFILDLVTGRLRQITDGFLGGIDEGEMVVPSLVRYPTFDGRQIPAHLYQPRGDGPFPAILSIHGGPEWQERPWYDDLFQHLLHRGIAILAPNVRGSTGYGKSFQKLIHGDWGGGELNDFETAALYLRSLDWVDSRRLGVFGGSFGGFATLSCVSRLPEYWAAAVDVVGPSNLVTFAASVLPTWRGMMASWVGDPATGADFLRSRSPMAYVDQIKAPLFVIRGARDPRVVKAQSDQIVESLRARGVSVRYDVYEDEGHGLTKRENELRANRDTAAFFVEHLLGGRPGQERDIDHQ